MWSLSLFVLNKTDSFACHLFLLVLFAFVFVFVPFRSFIVVLTCVVCISFASYAMNNFAHFFLSLSRAHTRSFARWLAFVGWHFKHQTIFQRCFCNLEYFIMHTFCVSVGRVFLQFYFSFALFIAMWLLLLLSLLLERFHASHSHSTSCSSSSSSSPAPQPLLLLLVVFATVPHVAVESKSIPANLLNE